MDRLVKLANTRNVSRYMIYTFPYPYTEADAKFWITQGVHMNNSVMKVIEYEDEFVGSVGFVPQTGWREHIAEIGFWLGEDYWKKGIATAALTEMTCIAFEEHSFRKLYASVLAPNVGSIRVLEKCGYEQEAHLKTEVIRDGAYYDVLGYSKFRA